MRTLLLSCATLAASLLTQGCVVIYKPNMDGLYSHRQDAAVMTCNYDVSPEAKLADSIKGVIGADLQGAGSNIGNNNGSNNKVEVPK